MRVRVAKSRPEELLDHVVAFGLTTLLYIYDSDEERRTQFYENLEKLRDRNRNLFEPLMVNRSTPSVKRLLRDIV